MGALNPDLAARFETTGTNFKRAGIAHGAFNQAFELILPVAALDTCHLKTKDKGVLNLASVFTSNFDVLIAEMAISNNGDQENMDDWSLGPRDADRQHREREWAAESALAGAVRHRWVLGGIYLFWVCDLALFGYMWIYTLISAARLVAFAEPIPTSARTHVALMALYESYRWIASPLPWLRARPFVRKSFSYYMYFCFNTYAFESDAQQPSIDNSDALTYSFTPALPVQDKAVYVFHPRGILTCDVANGAHRLRFAETDTRWLVAENLFWLPVLRNLLRWFEFDAVGKGMFGQLMKKGQNIGFMPGGFEEATLYARGKHRVYLKKCFGLIKFALQHGYKVYPAYTFGEELTYMSFPYFLALRLKLNEFKVPGAVFVGSLWCFFMPRSDADLVTVVGKPLEMLTITHPTKTEVKKYHAMYVAALQMLFEKHRTKNTVNSDVTLEVY